MTNELISEIFKTIDYCRHAHLKPKTIIINDKHALDIGGHICCIMKDGQIIEFYGYPVIISNSVDEIQIGVSYD